MAIVGPVQHAEPDSLAAEADPAHLQVSSLVFVLLLVLATLQLSSGLLDTNMTELKQTQPHALQLVTGASNH